MDSSFSGLIIIITEIKFYYLFKFILKKTIKGNQLRINYYNYTYTIFGTITVHANLNKEMLVARILIL